MKYSYQIVERIPKKLDDGIVYHNIEFELAALLCACGCGHRITLLVPDSHQISSKDGLATIRPSIGVFDAECRSHFFVTAGQVEWMSAFNAHQAALVMQQQIARHVKRDANQISWWHKLQTVTKNLRKHLVDLATFISKKVISFFRGQ